MTATLKATSGRIDALFDALDADPEKPDHVAGTWRYASLAEGALETGVWEATVATWTEDNYAVDEVCVMLAGHLRLTDHDGEVHDLREGDAFHLPRGWAGTWQVVEDMRKFYVILP
ncbi:MAG: cupin domain-containing protein [Actinomycetota bacterium]